MKVLNGQMTLFDLDTPFGKTCREHSQSQTEKILEPSSKCSHKSTGGAFQFLDLRKSGNTTGASWQMGIPSLGENWTPKIGSLKEENVSTLSQILEVDAPRKYSLSEKACQGVLRRAQKRGKELPKILKEALERQGGAISIENHPNDSRIGIREDGTVQTLTSRIGTGGGNTPMVMESICYGISPYHSNCMKSNNPHSGIYEAGTSKTLDCNGGNPSCNQGGIAVCEPVGLHGEVSATLDASYYKGCGSVYDTEREIVAFAVGNGQTANTGIHKITGALNCMHDQQAVMTKQEHFYIVRRLTPTECARLQGMPDWWCDDVPHSDASEYKMWGNGMALPCILYVLEGIKKQYESEYI